MLAFLYWLLNQTRQAADHLAGAATGEAALEAVEMAAILSGYADQVQDFCRWLVSTHHAGDAVLARLGQRPHDPSTRVEELAAHARQLRGAGLLARSAVKLQQAIELAPGRPGLHHELGTIYACAGDHVRAARSYVAELSLNPTHAPSLSEIGALYERDGNLGEAISWLELALKADPSHESARQKLLAARQRLS
jgi:tetratricopeptide (TPR) repeat protein